MSAVVVLAAVHTGITGWDVLCALLVAVVVILVARALPAPWLVDAAILFGVALLIFALLVSF